MKRSLLQILFVAIIPACVLAQSQHSTARESLTKTTVPYREVDGHRILADVYRPEGEAVVPVIVWIHGGALILGHRESVHRQVRSLAEEKGYAIVSIDYRLAPETKLPDLISDIEAAFVWLAREGADRFHLDPQRIAVVGGSAGGYLTLITGYRVEPRPKALVSLFGYGDLVGDWYSKPSPHPRHNTQQVTREEADRQTDGSVISDARERKGNGGLIYLYYRQNGLWPQRVSGFERSTLADQIAPYEPVRNVTSEFPPTMLIHGTHDTDVPYEQSTIMAAQFEQHGVPYILTTIEDGEHGFGGGNPDQIAEAYRSMREFIVEKLEAD